MTAPDPSTELMQMINRYRYLRHSMLPPPLVLQIN
jgi:hypothetical protein